MKKNLLVLLFTLFTTHFMYGFDGFGLFLEGGAGYNSDQNVGLGFVIDSKGFYTGVGAGLVAGIDVWKWTLGVNIDFLINPEISFTRGEEHYQVHNMADRASLRVMPYTEISRSLFDLDWLFVGFGIGYGYNNIYFSMRPLIYDKDYTSYQLESKSVTPSLFFRAYVFDRFYFSLNYEADIVVGGDLKRLAGDPLANFGNIDGATDIKGVHHRVRLVFGYVLSFDNY